MQLTKNFNIAEFNCRDGSAMPPLVLINIKLLATNLQALRDELGEGLHINSGYRSPEYNRKIGGVKDSQHVFGKASDITCKSKTPKQLAAVIEKLIKLGKMKQGGLGVYPGFVHYDTFFNGKKIRRW